MAKSDYPDWEIYKRDRCTCQYCGMSGIQDFNLWRHLSIDHVVPVSSGGPDTDDNKVVCCRRCNELLGGAVPEGKTSSQRMAWKRQRVRERNALKYADHQQMVIELIPAALS